MVHSSSLYCTSLQHKILYFHNNFKLLVFGSIKRWKMSITIFCVVLEYDFKLVKCKYVAKIRKIKIRIMLLVFQITICLWSMVKVYFNFLRFEEHVSNLTLLLKLKEEFTKEPLIKDCLYLINVKKYFQLLRIWRAKDFRFQILPYF